MTTMLTCDVCETRSFTMRAHDGLILCGQCYATVCVREYEEGLRERIPADVIEVFGVDGTFVDVYVNG